MLKQSNRMWPSPTHPPPEHHTAHAHKHTHTCTANTHVHIPGQKQHTSLSENLWMEKWFNTLGGRAQDFLRFRTGGTDHLLVCLPALSVTLSISQSSCLSNTYLYRSLIACAKRLSQNLPARLSVWLFLAELARQFVFNLFCQAFCLCVLVYICLPVCLSVCLFRCVYLSVWMPARLTASVFEWLPICLPVSFLSSQSLSVWQPVSCLCLSVTLFVFSATVFTLLSFWKKTKKLDTQLHLFNCLCLSLNSDCVGCKWCNRNLFFKA